jgi:hypothetical protein
MIIDSPIVSGSASASGSLNQHGDIVITGSLTVTGPITGALTGSVDSASFASTAISSSYAASATSASYAISATSSSYANDATSASYAVNASFLNGSGSGEFTPTGSFNTFSSSILTYTGSNDTNISNIHSTTASLNAASGSAITRLNSIESTTGSLNVASGSAITRLNALEVTSGSNITRINALEVASGSAITRLNALEVTSGSNITRISALESASGSAITRLNSIESTTGSLNIFSGSAQSQLTSLQAQTGSYATTGSNTFIGTQTITGSVLQSGSLSVNGCITSTGQIVAQTINVQQVTSSVVYSCGDNIFGTILSNSQTFTGSMFITGSNFRATVGTACFSGTVCAPAFVGGTISGTTATFSGALSLGSNTNYILFGTNPSVNPYIQGGSDDALYLGTGNLPRLTISPTGAATFSSSVTANSLIIKNSGVPAAQLFRDLDVISVGSAGQGIEFGARNGSTLTAGAAIYGGLDNPATTGTLVFQTMCNSSLSTKMTITSCGNVSIGVSDPDIFARGDARNVGIGASGASDNLALQLNAGGSGGRGAQIYMGQGGTRHFTISSNVTESTIGTTSNTPLRFVTCDSLERLRIFNTGITCFACQVCAKSLTIGTDCSGVVVDVANRHGLMKYVNFSTGLVGACSGTDSNIATWLGRFAGTIFSPTCVYQDLVITGGGNVGIGTINPSSKFHVIGNITIGCSTANSGMYGCYLYFPFNAGNLANGTIRAAIQFDSVVDSSVNTNDTWKWKMAAVARCGNQGCYNSSLEFLRTTRLGVTDETVLALNGYTGNVGIGTCTPASKLSVHGQFRVNTTSGDGNENRLFFNPGGAADPAQLYLYNEAQSNTIYITANGTSEFNAGVVCFGSAICANGTIFSATNYRVSTGTAAGNSSDPAITTGGCTKTGIYFAGSCVGLGSGGNGVLLNAAGTLFPAANGTQDLGTSSLRWCTVYTSDLSLNNGIGNYTIVEGESDLFLYNNNSCKVYKFIIQEVCPEIAPAKRSI